MKIQITQEHIDKGKRRDGCSCPVALALRDTFKVSYAYVSYAKIDIGSFPKDNLIFSKPLPPEVREKIQVFDMYDKGTMEPFEFELDLEGVKL